MKAPFSVVYNQVYTNNESAFIMSLVTRLPVVLYNYDYTNSANIIDYCDQ